MRNLVKVQGLEGDGDYSDGKVVISALPTDETATQFFMKVKMVP